jgi:hypothetical protein
MKKKDILAAVAAMGNEACREWVDEVANTCKERADFILWGKMFPPEALGPRCLTHAESHVGWRNISSASQISQWAIYDLRPIGRLHEKLNAE